MSLTSQPHRPGQQIDGPWLADKRWAGGRIADGSKGAILFLWGFALFWNAVTAPAVILGFDQVRPSKPETFLLFVFPVGGLCLLAAATYSTIRFRKFGRSFLELETFPGCPGGWLAGTVRTSAPLDGVEYVRLTLRCLRRVTTGSGKNRKTREDMQWESEQVLGGRLATERDGGHAIPIAFRIPSDAKQTFDSPGDDIVWRLRLHAPLPGADYSADFIVPVYAAAQPTGFVPRAEHDAAKIRAPREAVAVLDGSTLDISTNAAGRKRFVFPASRRRKTATVTTFVALALLACAWALVRFGGPWFFAVILGFIGSLFAWRAYVYWFRHVEFDVERGGIEHRSRVFPFARQRRLNATEIVGIEERATTTIGDKAYYTVFANVADRFDALRLVSGLRFADAEHVRDEVLAALGQHVDHAQRADQQADDAIDREERQADFR